jgi:protein-S-isoprenylcysteine O-methyltransferase Ste14
MKTSLIHHLRDILILPFTVTVIVPYSIYKSNEGILPDALGLKGLGILAALCGLALFGSTVYLFGKIANGTLAPWSDKSKLVVTGPYRYCRNPMISGVLFILIGEALVLSSAAILVWSAVFFMINTVYFLFVEEVNLLLKFGDAYRKYKRSVPRWLPRLTAYKG